jgi:hypothetical protein
VTTSARNGTAKAAIVNAAIAEEKLHFMGVSFRGSWVEVKWTYELSVAITLSMSGLPDVRTGRHDLPPFSIAEEV